MPTIRGTDATDTLAGRGGDVVLGLASSGAHSNGYSLVRRIVERSLGSVEAAAGMAFDGGTLADAMMAPTRIYVKPLLSLMAELPVKGMAHITGGGLTGNVPRVLPAGMRAVLRQSEWTRPALFDWLQREGQVAEDEMHRVFNCGIGMVVVVHAQDADRAMARLRESGETVFRIGEIEACEPGSAQAVVV